MQQEAFEIYEWMILEGFDVLELYPHIDSQQKQLKLVACIFGKNSFKVK